jgi:arylsulfatase A-like enzyme/cytochrome c2
MVVLRMLTTIVFCLASLVQEPLRNLERLEVNSKHQLDAVASRTLTWLTGAAEDNDYISVGRLANFFGFVKFRVASGHSLSRSGAGQETWSVLNAEQRAILVETLSSQEQDFSTVWRGRIDMNRALESMLLGEFVTRGDFLALGAGYGKAEAELGATIAAGLGRIAVDLDEQQKSQLVAMRGRYLSGSGGEFRLDKRSSGLPKLEKADKQELLNLSSRLLTWTTGAPQDNDFETVGKPSQHFGFVSLRVSSGHSVRRGNVAREVLALLDKDQERTLRDYVQEEAYLFQRFLDRRALLLRELEKALTGEELDRKKIAELGRAVGEVEAEMTLGQAHAILEVRERLSAEQSENLLAMRAKYVPVTAAEEGEEWTSEEVPSALADRLQRGRRIFAQCALCHSPGATGRAIAPSLTGVVGRRIASTDWPYSPGMVQFAKSGGHWTPQNLDRFLKRPRDLVANTTMGYDGLPGKADREALLAYLASLGEGQVQQEEIEAVEPVSQAPPNILFLLSDDQGWDGLAVEMIPGEPMSSNSDVRTPNLERLAAQGMRFSAAYAPASVCAPTRASLVTGKTPAHLGWTKAAKSLTAADGRRMIPPITPKNLAVDEVTIAELLQTKDYLTAHFGKWHLGGGGPGRHGFETHDGDTGNRDAEQFVDPNPVDIFGMVDRTIELMQRSIDEDRPFYAHLSFHALHYPENAMKETRAEVEKRVGQRNEKELGRLALAQDLDTGIGRLLDALDSLDLSRNTYVVYMSDNGAGGNRRKYLSGGKGGLGEGGIRVPFLVRGPGIAAQSHNEARIAGFDLFPTWLDIAGYEGAVPEDLDGGSLLPLWLGKTESVRRRESDLLFHFPHYQGQATPQSALFVDNLKVVLGHEDGTISLYDIAKDPGEWQDLSASRPELAKELGDKLRARLKGNGALLPKLNPDFDPDRQPQPKKKGKGNSR